MVSEIQMAGRYTRRQVSMLGFKLQRTSITSTLGRSAKMKKPEKTECWGRCGKNTNASLQAAAGTEVVLPGTRTPDTGTAQENCGTRGRTVAYSVREARMPGDIYPTEGEGGRAS